MVAAVPGGHAAGGLELPDDVAAGIGNLDQRVLHQSHDGHVAQIVGTHGVGIGVDVVIGALGGAAVTEVFIQSCRGGDIDRIAVGVAAHLIDGVRGKRTVGGVELADDLVAVGADEEQTAGVRADPLAVGTVDGHAVDLDAVHQAVGIAGAVVAGNLGAGDIECAALLEGQGGVEDADALGGTHPHVAVQVLGEAFDVGPRDNLAVLVAEGIKRQWLGALNLPVAVPHVQWCHLVTISVDLDVIVAVFCR